MEKLRRERASAKRAVNAATPEQIPVRDIGQVAIMIKG
jgi:hypothetical protein